MRLLETIFRFLEILVILLFQLGRYIYRKLLALFDSNIEPAFYKFVTELFEQLGPSFIKIGQMISTRPDLFPPELIQCTSRLQNNVKFEKHHVIRKIIQNDYGDNGPIASYDSPPIASGSIAQVHRAWLKNGDEVAIKIMRPGIQRRMLNDFRILRIWARAIEWIPMVRVIPLSNLVEEFRKTVEGQLNFRREVESNRRFAVMFQENENVIIPDVYTTLCTDNIIVMAYVANLKKLEDIALSTNEKEKAAVVGLQAIYTMMFKEGFIHGDLHPGNLFFRPGGRLVLLDFGLVAELKNDELDDYIEFFFSMATDNGQECARIIYRTAEYYLPRFRYDAFADDIKQMIHEFYNMSVESFEVSAFATRLFTIERKHGIKGATNFITVILALMVYEGIAKRLHPSLDFQEEARHVLIDILEGNNRSVAATASVLNLTDIGVSQDSIAG